MVNARFNIFLEIIIHFLNVTLQCNVFATLYCNVDFCFVERDSLSDYICPSYDALRITYTLWLYILQTFSCSLSCSGFYKLSVSNLVPSIVGWIGDLGGGGAS